jgi:hypothetical protein
MTPVRLALLIAAGIFLTAFAAALVRWTLLVK